LPLPLTFREIVAVVVRLGLREVVCSDTTSPSKSSCLLSEAVWISTSSTAPPVLNISIRPIAANDILGAISCRNNIKPVGITKTKVENIQKSMKYCMLMLMVSSYLDWTEMEKFKLQNL
jgi:hypothetical protein